MSLKSRIALLSALGAGCYVGFYNPKEIDADFKALWKSTAGLTTGSIQMKFSLKPQQQQQRNEGSRKQPRQESRRAEKRPAPANQLLEAGYKAVEQTLSKPKRTGRFVHDT